MPAKPVAQTRFFNQETHSCPVKGTETPPPSLRGASLRFLLKVFGL